ncbi:MAG: hypothetical protein WCK90_04775 [archaeon]
MELVAFVGLDRESWGQISGLVNRIEADRIVLVINKAVVDFPELERCEKVFVDSSMPLMQLRDDIKSKLNSKLSGEFEVALSIASGTGKEHMALVSALLAIPVGIKIAVFTQKGVEFLT